MVNNIPMASNFMKFRKFGFILTFTCSLTWFVDGMQISLASLLANSIQCDWKLTHFQTALLSSNLFIGMGLGAPLTGWLCDKIGRKPVLCGCLLLISYTNFLSVTSPNPFWFGLVQFLTGTGLSCILIPSCYMTEYFNFRYRGVCISIMQVGFACGIVYTSFMGYLLIDRYGWRLYLLLLYIITPFVFIASLWLPESIKYLQSTNNYEEIRKILHRISVMNGEIKPSHFYLSKKISNSSKDSKFKLITQNYLLKILLAVILAMSQGILYYGAIFLSNEIFFQNPACNYSVSIQTTETCSNSHNNKYIYSTFTASGDVFGLLIAIPIISNVDRRKVIAVLSLLNSLSFIVNCFCVPQYVLIVVIFFSRASSGVTSVATLILIGETFETKIRGTVLGIGNCFCRLTIVGVPFLVQWLLHVSYISTYAIFFVSCILSIVSSLSLPKVNVNDDIG